MQFWYVLCTLCLCKYGAMGIYTLCKRGAMGIYTPVSYTHLDVYKRQVFGGYVSKG